MKLTKIILLPVIVLMVSCNNEIKTTISITNELAIPRTFETIELTKSDLKLTDTDNLEDYGLVDSQQKPQIVQYVDTNDDGKADVLLFQPKMSPNSQSDFTLVKNKKQTSNKTVCYSRFVPERTDDYAWENDKVAFRVYGPTAQKMVEENIEGGTLSSGVDCWLKRVDYPIINKWYKKYTEKTGTYHEDTGEGLDNYHVGTSRGCGGISVKIDSTYYNSKNFINYKTITTGPIRTQFTLEYADWDVNGNPVKERRIITLDKGNNLSKFEISLQGTGNVSIGLTLHKNDGTITKNKENGWISYWEHLDDSELGTAVVIPDPQDILDFDTYISKTDDVKNQYVEVNVTDNKILYYAGFGWKKSKQINTNEEWASYLNSFSKRIQSPLKVIIN